MTIVEYGTVICSISIVVCLSFCFQFVKVLSLMGHEDWVKDINFTSETGKILAFFANSPPTPMGRLRCLCVVVALLWDVARQ